MDAGDVRAYADLLRNAGFTVAPWQDADLLERLFPWARTEPLPDAALDVNLPDEK